MAGASTLARPRPGAVVVADAGAPPGRTGPRPRQRRGFWLAVGAAVLAGLALRLAIGATDDAPSTDEVAYLGSGLSLVEGTGFARGGHPELHFPPLIPALLGATGQVVADPHTGAVILTWLTGTVLIVPLARLGRRLGGDRASVAVAWVAALAPGLATTPAARGAGSESEYTLMVLAATALVVEAAHCGPDRRGAPVAAAGAGLCLGLAYLARPEGLLLAVPLGLGLVLALRPDRRAVGRALAAFALPLAVCIVPYAAYLHGHTGRWELTAKTQDRSIEAWHAVARNDRETRDRELYTPDSTGWDFPGERTSLTALARDDPAGYAGIAVTNVRMLATNLAGWWLLPLPVWALAARGAWRRRRSGTVRLLVAVALVPVLTSLAFFVQPRYLLVTTAVACVLAGAELAALTSGRRRTIVVAAAAVMLLAASAGAFRGDGGWWHPVDHTDQRRAGEWIAAHTRPGERIMARSFVVEYYAERATVAMPYDDLDGILAFARHYGVRWLVVDQTSAARVRPQVLRLLTAGAGTEPDGLVLVYTTTDEGRTTSVFALDPAPPPVAEPGPPLGFMGDGG
jgi:hypothetical protein